MKSNWNYPTNVWVGEGRSSDVIEACNISKISNPLFVTDKDLIKSAINGMLANLDPHSSFMGDEDFQDMQVQTKGAFGGLGIEVTMEDGFVKVVSPIDDTPADKANIQPGDLIIGIDNEGVYGLTLDEAVEKLRGKIGDPVIITIRRGKNDPFEVKIIRDEIKISSVKSEVFAGLRWSLPDRRYEHQ